MVENAIDDCGVTEEDLWRLKASKEAESLDVKADGVKNGRHWATKSAEYRELRRLAAWVRDAVGDEMDQLLWSGSPDEEFVRIVADSDDAEAESWWSESVGLDADDQPREYSETAGNGNWIDGFIEGAMAVWDEIQGKL